MALTIVILNQQSLMVARQIQAALPDTLIYGLESRIPAAEVEASFANFGDSLRQLFAEGQPIVGICAAGILIRTLASQISDKRQEPPVLAVAEDGSTVVPLLGGLQGVNELARQIAAALNVSPAITTAGDLRFQTALLSPPAGYTLANPDDAKAFISNLLSGATLKLEGAASWLSESQLPFAENAALTVRVTEYIPNHSPDCLTYHPKTLAISMNPRATDHPSALIAQALSAANLSPASAAVLVAPLNQAADPGVHAAAANLQVPARFLPAASPELLARAAVGASGRLLVSEPDYAIAVADLPLDPASIGQPQGQLAIVGTGPGSAEWMSPQVQQLLQAATDWVGYSTYLDLVEPLRQGQQRHDSDNRVELERAKLALNLAAAGRSVALISSGDPGIYAMAAAVFEVLETPEPAWEQIQIQVAPGISALQAAAARVGAPIGHDFCAISLSDILKPWEVIERRIAAAAEADFVIAFYNPLSKQRSWQLEQAIAILRRYRQPDTPVLLARDVGRPAESVTLRTLATFAPAEVDMRTLVLIGSSKTRTIAHPNGVWLYTPRRYDL
ncbi:MAG: precorrin-3B C(17)-methyltransferase [Pegethrix bostrychoides GSE-TBD4-15B]|jgi:cobalt-precorrin 5A hydrolase/precorrin-3B C17-methyltransferase|uniref:Precorrin-3B C(17)-methyltransferase n=1 Tax=Pegethrix bostrychoides GSE-TBD4-15B TaxID=2839662 RepID=A0A951P8A9_9CYAN|nr:precorrin-3B C(17)-methyltransferase [Pegethrix bostrychoides GSE-TBD4-15B]